MKNDELYITSHMVVPISNKAGLVVPISLNSQQSENAPNKGREKDEKTKVNTKSLSIV
jgi:hypothetical protein